MNAEIASHQYGSSKVLEIRLFHFEDYRCIITITITITITIARA